MRDALGLTNLDYKRIKNQQKINNFLNAKCMLPVYTLYFGYKKAARLNRVKSDRRKWLDECYSILCEDFSDFIKEYRFVQPDGIRNKKYIWVFWLQGEASMPEVVQQCISSIKKNSPDGTEVVLVTANNLKSYVDFPGFIYKRLKMGSLTMTHFSDLIRMALLRKYGGLWIDSTVFVSYKIPSKYFDKELYSIQPLDKENRYKDPYYGGMTSFLVGGSSACMLFDFCYNFFIEYQRRYGHLLDGHLINICYRLAYNNFPQIRSAVDAIGVNNSNRQELMKVINNPYDEEKYKEITNQTIFHKLNWRNNYHEELNGVLTMYGYLKQSVE